MKNSPMYCLAMLLIVTSLLTVGCVSFQRKVINEQYQERTTVYQSWEPAYSTSSLWGRSKSGAWMEIWPSLPALIAGQRCLSLGDNLLFVGSDKGNPEKRLVQITFAGAPAIDLSRQILSAVVTARLLKEEWADGIKFKFDGLEENEHGIFVNMVPGQGASLGVKIEWPIKVPIPSELLKKKAEPTR